MEKEESVVVIDADSLVYYVGSNYQDIRIDLVGIADLDERIKDIFIKSKSANYVGFFGGKGGKNFRYDVAKTVGYKSAREAARKREAEKLKELEAKGIPQEEPWIKFWEPILKAHMKTFWGFTPVFNIEADDACIIAANSLEKKFSRVIMASPDKDLKQREGLLYDYGKGVVHDVSLSVGLRDLAGQMITGDSTDSIPGLPGAGPKLRDTLLEDIYFNSKEEFVTFIKKVYKTHFNTTLYNKEYKKQLKDFFIKYKVDNDLKRFTAKLKQEAVAEFKFVDTVTKTDVEIDIYFMEQYTLLHMLETEEEGKKYGFEMPVVQTETHVDWANVIEYEESLELTEVEEDFDFLSEL